MIPRENTILSGIMDREDETLVAFTHTGNVYTPYHFIMRKGPLERADIAGSIEDTLHRLLDNGNSDEDIQYILGAVRDDNSGEEDEEKTVIDLGYAIPGLLLNAWSEEGEEQW